MSGFKFVKQASDILSKMMSEKELEPSRLDLERLLTPIQSPIIAPYICDERMTFYASDCLQRQTYFCEKLSKRREPDLP